MTETLTIRVSPSDKSFVIHQSLLVMNSDYFAKATSGDWVEAKTKEHKLEEVNLQAFEMFVQWLYSGKVEAVNTRALDELLIRAWALGDRLQASSFKNAVVNTLAADWQHNIMNYPTMKTVLLAYEVSPTDSTLRRLAMRKCSMHVPEDLHLEDDKMDESIPQDLHSDLRRAMAQVIEGVAGKDPKFAKIKRQVLGHLEYEDICTTFHEHKDGEGCCNATEIRETFIMYEDQSIERRNDHVFTFTIGCVEPSREDTTSLTKLNKFEGRHDDVSDQTQQGG